MATSGTFTFNLDLSDAMEEAFERAGLELRSGYDYKTARRSLNLMMLEWQNRGLNLWSVEFATQALTAGSNQYQLDGKVLDIVEAFIRTDAGEQNSQFDQSMTRISVSQYSNQTIRRPISSGITTWSGCKMQEAQHPTTSTSQLGSCRVWLAGCRIS